MSQYLSQSLNQQMRMEQRLTPQLIQSMAILQKPVADLEAYIAEALEKNPALEQLEPQKIESDRDSRQEPVRSGEVEDEASRFSRLERFTKTYDQDSDSGDYTPSYGKRAGGGGDERDAKIDAMANTAGRDKSLNEHLKEQWALVELDEETRSAGIEIIDSLDADGYLRVSLDEIAANTKPAQPLATLERALREVKKLEPRGVGASNLVECLLLQIDALPGDNRIERALVENHLDDIAHNRLPAVAKATHYSVGEITEAIKAMRKSLVTHPGHLVGSQTIPRIRPDVIVEYEDVGGGMTVRLARGNSPKLHVSERLVELAKSKKNAKDTRDFARKHVEEASALIDAVNFRRSRLLDVAKAIVEKQHEFFHIGPPGLKICRMSDLANELECDPSTISRTVADKYLQCPRGIYPLRYFFTGGTDTGDGGTTSWDSVKVRVKELVEAEEKRSPLSDDQVANKLKEEGIEISRRTVAKYRQQLNIPAARQRKQF